MNIVDLLVALALISTLFRGHQVGFIRQLGSTIGFIGGILASVPAGTWVASFAHDPTLKSVLSTVTLLVLSFGLMSLGEYIGILLKTRLRPGKFFDHLDNYAGSLMAIVTFIIGLWFMTAVVSLLPKSTVLTAIRQSWTFNQLDKNLPPASQALASLNHLVDPNATPLVFSGREPSPNATQVLPSISKYKAVVQKVSPSIVRIQGLGCGGLVNGTGWVLSPHRIVTNAHVVAGVKNPKVYAADGTHDATVVLFDAKTDIAVLAVPSLKQKPLGINTTMQAPLSTALIIGYPGGGTEKAQTAAILSHVEALGRDIYGQTKTIRGVYVMQATVIPGNSGGPLLDTKGNVVGVIFGTSTQYSNVGYALSIPQLLDSLSAAKNATQAVSTETCSSE